ncbi:VaFE repeat-containing surface-anchored protein, partial [Leucobacter sp. M11]|uniref:VaFE repeat-containing surface-anchored protein n=1 Tax=Leucobacter sp. M11 TaxID=2993565 RepID=UPI002D8037D9
AEHTDIDDEAQTVTLDPVELSTSASDQADGDRVLPASGGVIVDVISFRGLTPGEAVTVRGELMDRTTGRGTGLTLEHSFVPTVSVGTVEVTVTVPSGFAGTTLVAFERLYDAAGELIAEHADLEDEAQTVRVESEVPGTPTPASPTESLSTTGGGPTGPAILGGAVLLLGGASLLLLLRRRGSVDVS